MSEITKEIQRYYRGYDEWHRLSKDPFHRLEFETTLRFLKRYLPPRGFLLDAGGGPGRYTIQMAKLGYNVVLLDLTEEHLDTARREVRKAGVEERVRGIEQGTVEDLSRFDDESFDAVLCLGGPLNHVLRKKGRLKAIRELVRVVKCGAPVFISVIGRLAVLETELVLRAPELWQHPEVVERIVRSGDYFGGYGFTACHFYDLDELETDLRGEPVSILERVGLQGLSSNHIEDTNWLFRSHRKGWQEWRRVHDATCSHPAVVASSQHFMVVLRKNRT